MDIVSYLLGKNSSGGGGGSASDYFVDTLPYNVSKNKSVADYIVKKIPPFSVAGTVTALTGAFYYNDKLVSVGEITNTSQVTATNSMFENCSSLVEIPLFDTSAVTNMQNMFASCTSLETVPEFDTSSTTNISGMFRYCTNLKNIPAFDWKSVTGTLNNAFNSCTLLTDESLNNIMASCITATSYTGTKNLSALSLSSAQKEKCQTLSNYPAFLDAGWTAD